MENTATTSNTTPTEKNKETGSNDDFDPSLSEEERRFYLKAYPTVDIVRERKVHCTVCKTHIGTAPCQEAVIKMHPVLRVTHCTKCHDFYNSGEFSKGEDGSELYCRWCGQGGEVYCCSNCPYVFCKTCIVKNLSRGVVADIEQNENWSCFNCAPKILWPLRAQHWALMKFIDEQKKELEDHHISESEKKQRLLVDRSTCCRLAKAKGNNMSDSMESIDSSASRRSQGSGNNSAKRPSKPLPPTAVPLPKRSKNANDEVVCTPDLITMLEPDCQITMSSKSTSIHSSPSPASSSTPGASVKNTTPKVMYIPKNYPPPLPAPQSLVPPPLVLRNTSVQMRPVSASSLVRRTVIGPQPPSPTSTAKPVYHTINGFRIDLNTAAQQETFRLPNGKLIQVKRQGFKPQNTNTPPNWQSRTSSSNNNNANSMQTPPYHHQQQQQQQPTARPMQTMPPKPHSSGFQPLHLLSKSTSTAAGSNHPPQSQPQPLRYHTILGNTTVTPIGISSGNSAPVQVINGSLAAPIHTVNSVPTNANNNINANNRPQMVRHVFPDTGIGRARTQLQNQIFNTNDICQHLINKLHTLTNSNAYKQAKSYVEMKELYIHLSYLFSYAIGRFKTLQDNSLDDMRQLGFVSDADSLENGQLAADKHASDDEIEIVEPKTDTITLDSDNESEEQNSVKRVERPIEPASTTCTTVTSTTVNQCQSTIKEPPEIVDSAAVNNEKDNYYDVVQPFLASMLEVEISEPGANTPKKSTTTTTTTATDGAVKKQPRKKTTIKPNPLLLKQKAQLEQERLEELKRSDSKLKMKCAVPLKKAEVEYPFARAMIDEKIAEKSFNADDTEMQEQNDTEDKEKKSETMNVSDNSTNIENADGSDLNENDKISDNTENKTDMGLKENIDEKIVDDNESSADGVVKSTDTTDEHAESVDVADNEESIDNVNDKANKETSKMECETLVTQETDDGIQENTSENCRDDDKEEEGTDMLVDDTEINEIIADVISNIEKELAKNNLNADSDSSDKDKNMENRAHEEVNNDDDDNDNDKTSPKCHEQKDNAESNTQKIVSLDAAIVETHKTESSNAEISTTTSAIVDNEEATTDLNEEEIVEATELHSEDSKDAERDEVKSIVDMDIADKVAKSSNNTSTMQRNSTELTNTIRVSTSVEVIET